MAALYSIRRPTRTVDKPGLIAVIRHDAQDGYSIRAHAEAVAQHPGGQQAGQHHQ